LSDCLINQFRHRFQGNHVLRAPGLLASLVRLVNREVSPTSAARRKKA
jgi:hypothetical protein